MEKWLIAIGSETFLSPRPLSISSARDLPWFQILSSISQRQSCRSMLLKFIFLSRLSGPRDKMEYSLASTVVVTCEWTPLRRLGWLPSTHCQCGFFHVFLRPRSAGYRQVILGLYVAVVLSPRYWKQLCIKYFHLCFRVTTPITEMRSFMQVPDHQNFRCIV